MSNELPEKIKDAIFDYIKVENVKFNKELLKEIGTLKGKIITLEDELEESYKDNDFIKDEMKKLKEEFKDNTEEIIRLARWGLSQGLTAISAAGSVSDEALHIILQEDLKNISIEKCRDTKTGMLPWEVNEFNKHLVKRGESLF